ncbi:MAG: DUF262 domain-containing protein [Deltaproteobacteria bacterium]|nr:DUF262 domain-containing protein [Deltaproteobacteria bacterium]
MDYHRRKIDLENKNIMELIHRLATGKFLIPTFQRTFIWDPEHIILLWDSIYRSYPIGTILYWETRTRLHVHRKIGGFFLPDGGPGHKPYSYILDGQQRTTSLLASYHGGTGNIKGQHSFDFTLYFDLIKNEFFFEKDYYKHKWEADSGFLIRLKDVLDLPDDYNSHLVSLPGYSKSVDKGLEQLRYALTHFSIPLIRLRGFDIEDVCGIYERINQTGVRLTNMDILIARGFKNYAVVVDEDFSDT